MCLCSDLRGEGGLTLAFFRPCFAGILRRVGCIFKGRPVVCIDCQGVLRLRENNISRVRSRKARAVLTEMRRQAKDDRR